MIEVHNFTYDDVRKKYPDYPYILATVDDKPLWLSKTMSEALRAREEASRESDTLLKIVHAEKIKTSDENNIITHPKHYCFGKYEPVKVIQDWQLDFCLGNVIKYVVRAGRKEDNSMIQDLEKAKQYLEFEIENLKNE